MTQQRFTRPEIDALIQRLSSFFGHEFIILACDIERGYPNQSQALNIRLQDEGRLDELFFPVHDWLLENGCFSVNYHPNLNWIMVNWSNEQLEMFRYPDNPTYHAILTAAEWEERLSLERT